MSERSLKQLLELYGQVEKIIMCTIRDGKYKGIPNGEAIVWMSLASHIPTSLWIIESQTAMFVNYEKQPVTCHRCGDLSHTATECNVYKTVRPDERDNAVSVLVEDDVVEETGVSDMQLEGDVANPILNDTNENSNGSSNDSSRSMLSSETDSEQNEELEFQCYECNKKCDTGQELNEHMKTHTSSYAAKAKSPPPSPQRERVSQPPASHSRKSGISASQPPNTSQNEESYVRNYKRGASASPTFGGNIIRERKFYKTSDQDKSKNSYYKG